MVRNMELLVKLKRKRMSLEGSDYPIDGKGKCATGNHERRRIKGAKGPILASDIGRQSR